MSSLNSKHLRKEITPYSKLWLRYASASCKIFKEEIASKFFKYDDSEFQSNRQKERSSHISDNMVGYCWVGFELTYWKDDIAFLKPSIYTGRSRNVPNRLSDTSKGFNKREKYLLYVNETCEADINTKSKYERMMSKYWNKKILNANLPDVSWDCFSVMEQSNINAVKKHIQSSDHPEVWTILNKKDEAGHSFYNPKLLKELKKLEKVVNKINYTLMQIMSFYRDYYKNIKNIGFAKKKAILLQKFEEKLNRLTPSSLHNEFSFSHDFSTAIPPHLLNENFIECSRAYGNLHMDHGIYDLDRVLLMALDPHAGAHNIDGKFQKFLLDMKHSLRIVKEEEKQKRREALRERNFPKRKKTFDTQLEPC